MEGLSVRWKIAGATLVVALASLITEIILGKFHLPSWSTYSAALLIAGVVGLVAGAVLEGQVLKAVSKLVGGVARIQSSSRMVEQTSSQLNDGVTTQAAAIQETSASVEEMSSMVKLSADHAKEASSLSQATRDVAKNGEIEIQQLINAMGEISQGSKKIEDIINVIDDIAFQTNLLALNAAVEAARAGEQGKGFAVVAEAVRGLSQKSATAAKEISTLIKDSVSKVENGSKIANESGEILKKIVTSVNKVADLNAEIASASHEQSAGIAQVSTALNEIDSTMQANAIAARETKIAGIDIARESTELDRASSEMVWLIRGAAARAKQDTQSVEVINGAIKAHTDWKTRLLRVVNGTSKEKLEPATVGMDNQCGLGKWIYGDGKAKCSNCSEFDDLIQLHADFHKAAAEVITTAKVSGGERASNLIQAGSRFAQRSEQVVGLLSSMKFKI